MSDDTPAIISAHLQWGGRSACRFEGLDHVVLTARNVQVTADFYARVLGMRADIHEDSTHTSHYAEMYFGSQKINVHQAGHEFDPKALHPAPGTPST